MTQYLIGFRYWGDQLRFEFWDSETNELWTWVDTPRSHYPYFLMRRKLTPEEIEREKGRFIMRERMRKIEFVTRYHPREEREIKLLKINMASPRDVALFRPDEPKDDPGVSHPYESRIRYYARKSIDLGVVFGMPHEFQPDGYPLVRPTSEVQEHTLFERMNDYPTDILTTLLPIFLEPIPDIPYMTFDLEALPRGKVIPNPKTAPEPIISVAFSFSDDRPGKILALSNTLRRVGRERCRKLEKAMREGRITVEFFESEQALLRRTIKILNDPAYPLLVTFNGDSFDLPYLAERCKYFSIPTPIRWRETRYKETLSTVGWVDRHGVDRHLKIHLDLCKYFDQTYVRNYAFRGKYGNRKALDIIAQSLLGVGKVVLPAAIGDLSVPWLCWYNFIDADLLDQLMKFNHQIVPRLLFLMCRIGYESLEECCRKAISRKIENMFINLCSQRGWLIPNNQEMKEVGEFVTAATIDGKKFRGAAVLETLPGPHFNVSPLDFASLYPTIVKEYNMSFETINCSHPECRSNRVPGTTAGDYKGHWVCTQQEGLISRTIGLFRDVRVRWFKPEAKNDPQWGPVEQALKVLMNASVGVFGATHFMFLTPPLIEAVVSMARYALLQTDDHVKREGIRVVLGDTDSVYLENVENVDSIIDWAKRVLKLDLELETPFQFVGVSARKKNYFCVTVDGEVVQKGILTKKGNTPDIYKEWAEQVFQIMRQVTDQPSLRSAKVSIRRLTQRYAKSIATRQVALEKLVYRVKITRPVHLYKVRGPHVRAALMEAAEVLRTVPMGMRVPPEQLVEPGTIQEFVKGRPQKGRTNPIPLSLAVIEDIDPTVYLREFSTVAAQILEPLGLTVEECGILSPFATDLRDFF